MATKSKTKPIKQKQSSVDRSDLKPRNPPSRPSRPSGPAGIPMTSPPRRPRVGPAGGPRTTGRNRSTPNFGYFNDPNNMNNLNNRRPRGGR